MKSNTDIIKGDYRCPHCQSLLNEKRPKDKFVIRNKERTVRLFCVCGYYRDDIVKFEDFKEFDPNHPHIRKE